MGKGKRLRRERKAIAQPDQTYPFIVDARTSERLGREGLAELAANLWPQDCQTCGWDLGEQRATVQVQDLIAFGIASLHHQRCQSAQWIDTGLVINSGQALLTHDLNAFFLPEMGHGDSEPVLRPCLAVNPSLELVHLKPDSGGQWRVSTMAVYRSLGLRTPAVDLHVEEPIAGINAELDGGELTVTLPGAYGRWTISGQQNYKEAVRDFGGVMLAVSTAIRPSTMGPQQFFAAMRSGQIAMGWIALSGTTPPLRPTSAPSALTTFILHFDDHHAWVGEPLTTTDPTHSAEHAHAWASQHIGNASLLPWQQHPVDPTTWFTIDALSARHYFLHHRTDAWSLIHVLARIDGEYGMDEPRTRKWAANTIGTKAHHQVIDWIPSPSPDTGTTLHAIAAPR